MKHTLLIRTRVYGFFSCLFQVLDNLKYCEINNLKPLILYDETFQYNNGLKNAWSEFYEPINDEIIEGNLIDIYSCTDQVELFFMRNFLIVNPSKDHLRNFNLKIWELYANGEEENTYNHRKEINNYISKYLKPKKDILNEINNFSDLECGKTIAVHCRGTDFCYDGNHLELLINETRVLIEKYNYKNIFIASDNKEAINLFLKKFNNVFFYETELRMDRMDDPKPIFHCVDGDYKIKQGKDVLIESIIMSKCDRIVCVNSNVAAFSCYLNPNMHINLVKKGLGGTGLI